MALERFGSWKEDSSVEIGENEFFLLRRDLVRKLSSNGKKEVHGKLGERILLSITLGFFKFELPPKSLTEIKWDTSVDHDGTTIPLKIYTDYQKPHSDDPKKTIIRVSIKEGPWEVLYKIGKHIEESSLEQKYKEVGGSRKLLPVDVLELHDLIKKIR